MAAGMVRGGGLPSGKMRETSSLRRQVSMRLERHLSSVPGLLDPAASPCDVLPVSVALHCVLDDDPVAGMHRHHSSPAELGSLGVCYDDPRRPHWRHQAKQVAWLMFLFVALDTSKSLAVSWAAVHGHMCAPLVIGVKNALSIGCGLLLATLLDGSRGFRECLDIKRSLKVFPIAGAFCAAQVFALQALRAFDAGSLKVMAQVNLPTTALLSWLVLGRHYSGRQWLAIALLLNVTMAFLQVRMLFFSPPQRWVEIESGYGRAPDKGLGMLYFLGGVTLSCSASIFAERFLKDRRDVPFYIQKTNLMFGELLSACFMAHLHTDADGNVCSWEQIHDWRQLPVILIWFIHGWIAGLLVKRCSALVKNVSHILSALVTYFLPLIYGIHGASTPHFWPVTLSALLVLIAVLVFATVPPPPPMKQKSARSSSNSRRSRQIEVARPVPRASSESKINHLIQQSQTLQSTLPSSLTSPQARTPETSRPQLCKGPEDAASGDRGSVGVRWAAPVAVPVGSPPSPQGALSVTITPQTATPPPAFPAGHGQVWLLVLCFIVLDAMKPLLVTWASAQKAPQERFIHGTFVLVQTSLSLLVGLLIAVAPVPSLRPRLHVRLHTQWRARLRRCVDMRAVMQQLPVSGCLCFSKLMLVMALSRLDAGTVRVFGSASLPLAGVGSVLLFRRRYTLQQWCSLIAISVALLTFYYVKAEVQVKKEALARPLGSRIAMVPVLLVLGSICFNSLGALLVEKFLKRNRAQLHEQKAQLLLGEVMVNFCLVFGSPLFLRDPQVRMAYSVWHRGFFAGWDGRVLICALIWIPAGWTATMLVKRCSNLLKTIAQGTASVLTYVFTVVPLSSGPRAWQFFVTRLGPPLAPEPFSAPVVMLAITVMLATLTFGTDSSLERQKSVPEQRRGGSDSSRDEAVKDESIMSGWHVDSSYKALLPVTGPPKRQGSGG